jgi:hypothetical protein
MRHPFDGVNGSSEDNFSRRSALGAMVAATAGVLGWNSPADAQRDPPGMLTTLAMGGEGGAGVPLPATTEPFSEEAGKVVSRMTPGLEDGGTPQLATAALNEQGVATSEAKNEEGGVRTTRALGEEGGVTKARFEEGVQPVIPVKPASVELKKEQLQTVWTDLSDKDAVKGVQACAVLYGAKNGLSFLKDNLTTDKIKLRHPNDKTIARLIADLDADDFDTRETAESTLSRMGPTAAVTLERALKASKSVEQTMRLGRLVEVVKNPPTLAQARRALEVLVALRTPEARELLEKLAKGDEAEWLTRAAREALERASRK